MPRRPDLLVIGGGTAGLVAAVGAAGQGARTVLVERERTGGDCLWTGCVPSKALLTAAEAAHTARSSQHLGVRVDGEVRVDLATVLAHVRAAQTAIAPHDSPERLRREGVEVVSGSARFVAPDAVDIDGRRLGFRAAVVATGSEPVVPDLPGLAAADPLTSDTVWDLTELPARLVVLGGGAIGCELGQAFARLGSQVTLVEVADDLLPREEPAARAVLAARLRAEGIDVRTSTRAVAVEPGPDGPVLRVEVVDAGRGGEARPAGFGEARTATVPFDRILVAVGRRPRTAGLGLDVADIAVDARGAVQVDDRLRTTNRRVWAAGDVTLRLPFTHVAAAHGATIVQNALFGLRRRVDHERLPWVTFTDPEVARVGLTEAEARERFGDGIRVRTAHHDDLDRAVTAGRTEGFATLVGDPKGRIVGATVVGPRAGEVIAEVVAWMAGGATIGRITRTTHAYPTWTEDLTAASLAELRTGLAKLAPVTRTLLAVRRLRR